MSGCQNCCTCTASHNTLATQYAVPFMLVVSLVVSCCRYCCICTACHSTLTAQCIVSLISIVHLVVASCQYCCTCTAYHTTTQTLFCSATCMSRHNCNSLCLAPLDAPVLRVTPRKNSPCPVTCLRAASLGRLTGHSTPLRHDDCLKAYTDSTLQSKSTMKRPALESCAKMQFNTAVHYIIVVFGHMGQWRYDCWLGLLLDHCPLRPKV